MVGVHQNLNGLRDLTTHLAVMVCHPWVSTCYDQPNFKSLSIPTTKIWKAMHNDENWMVWISYGSLKVIGNSRQVTV